VRNLVGALGCLLGAFDTPGVAACQITGPITHAPAELHEVVAGIDLIVASAYGHSRLREWVRGGVTLNLLLYGDRCALVSH